MINLKEWLVKNQLSMLWDLLLLAIPSAGSILLKLKIESFAMINSEVEILTNLILGCLLVWLHRKVISVQSLADVLTIKIFIVNEVSSYRHNCNLTFQGDGYVNCIHGLMKYTEYLNIERKAIRDAMVDKMQDINVKEINEQLNAWYK